MRPTRSYRPPVIGTSYWCWSQTLPGAFITHTTTGRRFDSTQLLMYIIPHRIMYTTSDCPSDRQHPVTLLCPLHTSIKVTVVTCSTYFALRLHIYLGISPFYSHTTRTQGRFNEVLACSYKFITYSIRTSQALSQIYRQTHTSLGRYYLHRPSPRSRARRTHPHSPSPIPTVPQRVPTYCCTSVTSTTAGSVSSYTTPFLAPPFLSSTTIATISYPFVSPTTTTTPLPFPSPMSPPSPHPSHRPCHHHHPHHHPFHPHPIVSPSPVISLS